MKQAFNSSLLFLFFIVYVITVSTTVVEAQKCLKLYGLCGENNGTDYEHSENTKAILTLGSFAKVGDRAGRPSACDGKTYQTDDNSPVVALSTGWFNKKKRCHHFIDIQGNGRIVKAMVVDERHSPYPGDNVVDASKAVWKGLGINENDKRWGWMDITWSDDA